jgi:hypothetical protein
VATARNDDAAQVGDSGDDMAPTAFLALAPRLRRSPTLTTSSPTSRSTTAVLTPTYGY